MSIADSTPTPVVVGSASGPPLTFTRETGAWVP